MRLTKWIRIYQNPNYKPPTPKQLERLKIREHKIMKELYESDFHEITWDKKNPQEWSDFYLDIYEKSLI